MLVAVFKFKSVYGATHANFMALFFLSVFFPPLFFLSISWPYSSFLFLYYARVHKWNTHSHAEDIQIYSIASVI